MPYCVFLPLPAGATAVLRSDVALWRPGDGTKIGAGLVEEVDSLDDISIGNAVQVGSGLLILVLLAHAAAQCKVSRKLDVDAGRATEGIHVRGDVAEKGKVSK